MSATEQYRRQIEKASGNIVKLQKDKSRLSKKISDCQKKIADVTRALNSTRSISTANMRIRQIDRSRKEISDTERRIATIEGKISEEHKKQSRARKSLSEYETKEAKRKQIELEQAERRTRREMKLIDSRIDAQESNHETIMEELEKLKNLPEKITVLLLASNPLNLEQLRLDEEARAIQDMIRKSAHRDAVNLESRWAVRPLDVLQAINECTPRIVHFSGHGTDLGEIVFHDESGNAKYVSVEAIVQSMRTCAENIQLVFFNTCHSHSQAREAVTHVYAAVGMHTSIGDDAARVFASQFYSAIGFGKSVKEAFEQARAALMLEDLSEEDTPVLFVAEGLDANRLYMVKSPGTA